MYNGLFTMCLHCGSLLGREAVIARRRFAIGTRALRTDCRKPLLLKVFDDIKIELIHDRNQERGHYRARRPR